MAIHDFTAQRLFIDAALSKGARIACDKDQSHYLLHVLRSGPGDAVLIFNGQDGEWRARLNVTGKRSTVLIVEDQVRPQQAGPDIHLLFAPLKRGRLDYMVQKAAELGVAKLQPVFTRHTVPDRVNVMRMRANAIEAAEQCGILYIPEVCEAKKLTATVESWDGDRALVYCDEQADHGNPIAALGTLTPGTPVAVLVGPEGGFSGDERRMLGAMPCVLPLSLGPRIMRADTAATAVLALVNAVIGDWRGP